jgi:hypothetical protein
MKLHMIIEAYDKNLGDAIATKYQISPQSLKAYVRGIDPELTYGAWILKALRKYLEDQDIDTWHELDTNDLERPEANNATQLAQEIKTQLDTFKSRQAEYPEQDLNKYTLESLKAATSALPEIIPAQPVHTMPGAKLVLREEPYEAYEISKAKTLARLSKGAAWCVKDVQVAKDALEGSKQIMILRNGSPTCLFATDFSQVKNSGNTDETRPEIITLIRKIWHTYLRAELETTGKLEGLEGAKFWGDAHEILELPIEPLIDKINQMEVADALEYLQELGYENLHRRLPELEAKIITAVENIPDNAPAYTSEGQKSEPSLASRLTYWAFEYAEGVIKGRWPEIEEPLSRKIADSAYMYALNVIKGRWPQAEPLIISDPSYSYNYAHNIIGGRWPEAEEDLSKGHPSWATHYAKTILKGRFKAAEDNIFDPKTQWAYIYIEQVPFDTRIDQFEKLAANPAAPDPQNNLQKAIDTYIKKVDWANPANDYPIPKAITKRMKNQ